MCGVSEIQAKVSAVANLNCDNALSKYVTGKIIEKCGKELCDSVKSEAMSAYNPDNNKIHGCILRKYTSPKKYEYSDAIKILDAKLKDMKKEEEANGKAVLIPNTDATVFTVIIP